MTQDRWQEILEMVKSTFSVEDSGSVTSEVHGGTTSEFIVFSGPLGRLKLEFITQPALVDTKTTYKKRIGADVLVEQVYSPTDIVHRLEVWKWNEDKEAWDAFQSDLF